MYQTSEIAFHLEFRKIKIPLYASFSLLSSVLFSTCKLKKISRSKWHDIGHFKRQKLQSSKKEQWLLCSLLNCSAQSWQQRRYENWQSAQFSAGMLLGNITYPKCDMLNDVTIEARAHFFNIFDWKIRIGNLGVLQKKNTILFPVRIRK